MPAKVEKFEAPANAGAIYWKIFNNQVKRQPEQDTAIAGDLKKLFLDTQPLNRAWTEDRFKVLREASDDWSLDIAVVNGEGRMVGKQWSSYQSYKGGEDLPPSLEDLKKMIEEEGRLVFPISPLNDTAFVWFREHAEHILPVLDQGASGDLKIGEYPLKKLAPKMPDMVQMARIPRERVGSNQLAAAGVVYGKVGFWENLTTNISDQPYIPRAVVRKSPLVDSRFYVSPIQIGSLIKAGGLPMEEKYQVGVVRTDPELTRVDFIAAALVAASDQFQKPVALSFTTYRSWMDEVPRHGKTLSH